ncbi:MAG TPA: FtsH protease activity modulator HflK [Candidatus Methylacidiphilales bacterium]
MTRRTNDSLFSGHATLAALRSSIRLLVIGMIFLVLIYLASGVTVVGPNEVGVLLRFGKIQSHIYPPGLLLALPLPIDEVIKVPVKTVQEASLDLWATAPKENDISLDPVTQRYSLTGDVNIVRAKFVLRYQISDPIQFVLSANHADQLRDAILYESASQVLGSMKVDDALTSRKYMITLEAMRRAQEKIARLKLGLHLVAFEVREINPPRSVVASFQDVVSAKLQAKTLVEQANAYAATELPSAKADAYRTEQNADAYAQQVVAKAQGEASAFLAQLHEYKANPVNMRARLIGEMRQTVLPETKILSVMPDQGGDSTVLLSPKASP